MVILAYPLPEWFPVFIDPLVTPPMYPEPPPLPSWSPFPPWPKLPASALKTSPSVSSASPAVTPNTPYFYFKQVS